MTKYFGIGLQRTGTTSLHTAAQLVGLRSAPMSIPLLDDLAHPLIDQYDLFSDNPIPLLYPTLDKQYPNSKFILTTRPVGDWLKSVEWLFATGMQTLSPELRQIGDEIHRRFYGQTTFSAVRFRTVWEQYHADVDTYFQDRPDDLLRLDFGQGDGWAELCPFLGVAVPDLPFPHRNRAYRPSLWQRFKQGLQTFRA